MKIPIDVNKNWRFLHHTEIDPNGISCNLTNKDGKLLIKTVSGLVIELDKYNEKEETISGHYTIKELNILNEIVFKKNPDFLNLIGAPQGFHGLPKWRLQVIKG